MNIHKSGPRPLECGPLDGDQVILSTQVINLNINLQEPYHIHNAVCILKVFINKL